MHEQGQQKIKPIAKKRTLGRYGNKDNETEKRGRTIKKKSQSRMENRGIEQKQAEVKSKSKGIRV